MKRQPKISIIMNCYNGEAYVKEAIDSIFAQTYKNWEIIFWDNNSTDNSANIAKSFGLRVKYFRSAETIPLTQARNKALIEANGEYIAFLDCDDLWLPHKLEKQIDLLESNKKLGFVFSDSIFFYEDGYSYLNFSRREPQRGKIFRALLAKYFIDIETVVLRRQFLIEKGISFNEEIILAQDRDLFLKVAYYYDVDYVSEPLAKWRIHSGGMSNKHYEQAILDEEYILNYWKKTHPNFTSEFEKEIQMCQSHMIWQKAMVCWNQKQIKKFRNELLKGTWKDLRKTLVYILSFFPPGLLDFCFSRYQRR